MRVCLAVNEMNIRGGTHKQILRLAQYLRKKIFLFNGLQERLMKKRRILIVVALILYNCPMILERKILLVLL